MIYTLHFAIPWQDHIRFIQACGSDTNVVEDFTSESAAAATDAGVYDISDHLYRVTTSDSTLAVALAFEFGQHAYRVPTPEEQRARTKEFLRRLRRIHADLAADVLLKSGRHLEAR